MKICRFQLLSEGSPANNASAARYGILEENSGVRENRDPFSSHKETGKRWAASEIKLLAPCEPSKIVCVGRNYAEHAAEMGNEVPKEPLIFLKPPSAVIASGEPIILTPLSERVDYEGELAVVIGKTCARLKHTDDVRPYICGFTCLNDVTARDLQKKDVQFTRAKSFDTFCPLGPAIETELDAGAARVETFVNGVRRQSASAREMIFPVDFLLRWISQVMTLFPGDVIATGTPSGIGPLQAGDTVEVRIGGIGSLINPAARPA